MNPESNDPTRFDARNAPCGEKHAQIFQRWTDLSAGQHFILVNDHDPIPLYHQFAAQFPGAFSWEYIERGPEVFQVKITRLAAQGSPEQEAKVFDVRPIPPRVKHAQIFQRWLDLAVGDYFILLNDHDPVPLRYQFEAEFTNQFSWEYLAKGPEEFRVKITRLVAGAAAEPEPATASTQSVDEAKVFDVRPIPPRVKHAQIFQRWLDLAVGDYFVLLNDHDPVPLRYQFEREFGEAFSWEYLEKGPEEFRVKISKKKAVSIAEPQAPTPSCAPKPEPVVSQDNVHEVDARGLEPPEPLIRVLDALESLPAGASLKAITDREPCHLFGEAEQRGFNHDSNEQPDGSWITLLTRA